MSTSILYHGFGVKNYRLLRTEFECGAIWFHVEKKPEKRFCARCKSQNVTLAGCVPQTPWRTLPIGMHPVFLVPHLHFMECHDCGAILQEEREVADPYKRFTHAIARYALLLAQVCTIADAAFLTGLSWDTVKDLVKEDLQKKSTKLRLRGLRLLAIDEIAYGKGQKYLTVVLDLETNDVVHVAEGHSKESLAPFFKRLRYARVRLKAIAVDMHEPYRASILEYYRRSVAIVHDRFHVVKLLNEALDEVRRDEMRNATSEDVKRVLTGIRYLVLRANENLKDKNRPQLEEMLQLNLNLSKAYILKEQLRLFWNEPHRRAAKKFLKNWVKSAMDTGIQALQRFAKTLVRHTEGLLAYFKHPITTGPLEGLNNAIKVLKRKAYGYRDLVFFKLRILFIHQCRLKLSGA